MDEKMLPSGALELFIASGIFGYLLLFSAIVIGIASVVSLCVAKGPRLPLALLGASLFPFWCGAVGTILGFMSMFGNMAYAPTGNTQEMVAGAYVSLMPLLMAAFFGFPLVALNLITIALKWSASPSIADEIVSDTKEA